MLHSHVNEQQVAVVKMSTNKTSVLYLYLVEEIKQNPLDYEFWQQPYYKLSWSYTFSPPQSFCNSKA